MADRFWKYKFRNINNDSHTNFYRLTLSDVQNKVKAGLVCWGFRPCSGRFYGEYSRNFKAIEMVHVKICIAYNNPK